MTTDDEICTTCNKPHPWPNGQIPKHPFNGINFGKKKDEEAVGPVVESSPKKPAWPFDPVLRQALVDKGVITIEDLHRAEDKIRTLTNQYEREVDRGQRGRGQEGVRVQDPS